VSALISTKTEVQCIGREGQETKLMLGNNESVQCEDFIYVGGVISQDSTCDKDVALRIELAADIVRNLRKVWKAKDISKATKVLLYQTLIQSVISYNAETWTLKERHKRKLRVFEMSVLRKISGVTRRDHVRNFHPSMCLLAKCQHNADNNN